MKYLFLFIFALGFSLPSSSEMIPFSKAKKATVLVFLSARCPCSASHEEKLKRLAEEFSQKGFQFFGVHANADETAEESKLHFQEVKFPFPVFEDLDQTLLKDFPALKTPHVFVVSPSKKILYQGGVDESHIGAEAKKEFLREALTALNDGKEPSEKMTRSLGCVIKRK